MAHGYKMTRARHSSGAIVKIENVPNGKLCDSYCLNCGSELVAKNMGMKMAKHFSHYDADPRSKECSGSFETELHILAKEVLEKEKTLNTTLLNGHNQEVQLVFESVTQEQHIAHFNAVPDLTCNYKGYPVYIEICVKHKCEESKIYQYRQFRCNVLEIYLSSFKPTADLITYDEVKEAISKAPKSWLSIDSLSAVGELAYSVSKQTQSDLIRDIRQLTSEQQEIEVKISYSSNKLNSIEEKLGGVKPDYQSFIKKRQELDDEINRRREALDNLNERNRAEQRNIQSAKKYYRTLTQRAKEEETQLIENARIQAENLLKDAYDYAQEEYNQTKGKLEQDFLLKLESEHMHEAALIDDLQKERLSKESEIEDLIVQINELKNLISSNTNKERELKKSASDIETKEKNLNLRVGQIIQTLSHLLPNLRGATSRHGYPMPYNEADLKTLRSFLSSR